MTFPLSQALAMQGMTAPSPAASAMPAGAVPVNPAVLDPYTGATPSAGGTGMNPRDMLALMQAFGGLKMPGAPPMMEAPRPPQPVAPQGANPAAIANTGNTGAIASLLSAGIQPQQLSALGQLVMGGR